MGGPELKQIGSLGKGTSGQVVQAELTAAFRDLPAGTPVAQKRPLSPADLDSLDREAEVLGQVSARTLQASIGSFEDSKGPFLLTHLIRGPSLSELVSRGPMEDGLLRRVGKDLAEALAALHGEGWLHGDLAPGNARLDPSQRAVLLDLGFAMRIEGDSPPRGTPAYFSPEEASGKHKTSASEVYSLGLILWELATGRHPHAPDGSASSVLPESLLTAILSPPSTHNPPFPPDLDELLGRMTDEDPSSRPTAREVAAWLDSPPAPESWGEDPWAARDCLPFVGHGKALGQLRRAWESAAQGSGRTVWLEAPRGLGKTRLMAEFVRSLRRGSSPPTYLTVRCPPALEGRPTHPIRALLRRWLALGRHTPAGEREQDLLTTLAGQEVAEALIQTLDPAADSPARVEVPLLGDWLLLAAGQAPLVIFMDEVERAGEATHSVLMRLIEATPDLPLLLVLGVRDGDAVKSGALAMGDLEDRLGIEISRVALAPLDQESVADLIDLVFAGSVPADRLGRIILDRTMGRPARIDSLIQQSLQRGLMRVHPGGGLMLVGLPESLPRMAGRIPDLQERLGRMDSGARTWLERIAVHGLVARPGRLARTDGATPEEVSAVLAQLLGDGWLERGPDGPAFPSATIRDGILASIPPNRLQELHAHAADALAEQRGSGRAFERAFHLKQAGRTQELVQVVLELLPQARDLGHPTRVLVLVDWALEASAFEAPGKTGRPDRTPISAQQSLDLHAAAAEAAGGLGRRTEEARHLNALVDLPFDSQSHPSQVALVYLLHGHAAADTGRIGLARGYLRNAAKLGRRGKQGDLAAEASRRLAEVELAAGNRNQAIELVRMSRSSADSTLVRLHAQLTKGLIALLGDRPTRGRAHAQAVQQKCIDFKDTPRQAEVRARAWILEARCDAALGESKPALEKLRQALSSARQAGLGILEAEAHARLGRVLLDLGEDQHAEQELREAQLIAQESRLGQGEVLAQLFLGTLLCEQGQRSGPRLVQGALKRAGELSLVRIESVGRAIWARVLLSQGRREEARLAATSALESLQRVGAELSDRIVIVCTHQLCWGHEANPGELRAQQKDLDRRIARVSRADGHRQVRQRAAASLEGLMASALSPEGPLYPRREG